MNILLVPADIFWAEGKIALNIFKQSLKDSSNRFIVFPAHQIRHRREEFESLLRKVDAVHWLMNASNVPYLANKEIDELGVFSITTLHHAEDTENYKIEKIRKANLIHVVSSEWKDHLANLNLPSYKASLGVNTSKYRGKYRKEKHAGIIAGHFGNITNVDNRKRFDVLVAALELCKKNKLEVELRLAGRISTEALQLLKRKGIYYTNLGYLSEKKLIKAYAALDVYIITSDCEGGPFGVIEALSCSTPVISTKVGIALDVIEEGVNSFLIPKNNPEALYKIIKKLAFDNEFEKISVNARKSVLKYDWRSVYDDYLQLYRLAPTYKTVSLFTFIYANFKTFALSYYLKYKRSWAPGYSIKANLQR